MKKKTALFIFLFLSIVGYSEAKSENQFGAAEGLLQAMGMEDALQKTIGQMLTLQLQQQPSMKPYEHVFLDFFNKYMSYESLKADLIQLYTEAFTENELHEIAAFYKTPTGKKTMEKLPELSAKCAQIGIDRVQKNMAELNKMIEKESGRIQELQNNQ